MRINRNFPASVKTQFTMMIAALLLVACGGGGSSSSSSSSTTSNTVTNQTGTGSGSLTTIPSTTGHAASIVVDAGPVSGTSSINVPYVSVTVCTPGTSGSTAACQTIDHVTLDTGSYGLRLLNSALSSNLTLPAVTASNGQAVGECTAFVIGTTWGSVRLADIYIGGEVAKNIPIQDIGDHPGGASGIPTDCSNTGTIEDTQAALGSNGILGIGLFVNDCDTCLSQVVAATYYTCSSSGGCSNSKVTSSQVVKNPVASFAVDNNGTLIKLPSVSSAGSTGLSGTITFGIGTETDNTIGTATVYYTDSSGNFTTTFNNTTMSSSYLDSGSNGLFFVDASLTQDSAGWYIPTSPLTLSATNTSHTGLSSGAISFTLVDVDTLPASIVAANIGGAGSSGSFAWGLPFFFGRTVYTGISGITVSGYTGPYWAY